MKCSVRDLVLGQLSPENPLLFLSSLMGLVLGFYPCILFCAQPQTGLTSYGLPLLQPK